MDAHDLDRIALSWGPYPARLWAAMNQASQSFQCCCGGYGLHKCRLYLPAMAEADPLNDKCKCGHPRRDHATKALRSICLMAGCSCMKFEAAPVE